MYLNDGKIDKPNGYFKLNVEYSYFNKDKKNVDFTDKIINAIKDISNTKIKSKEIISQEV